MKKHFQYFWYFCRHKWFVLIAGLKLRVSIWRLIKHDISKLLPSEWIAYAEYFHGRRNGLIEKGVGETDQRFREAWNRHQKRNDHHWQYYLLTLDKMERFEVIEDEVPSENNPCGVEIKKQGKWFCDVHIKKETKVFEINRQRTVGKALYIAEMLSRVPIVLPMPDVAIREMVADWAGAGKALKGEWEVSEWYEENKKKMILHWTTRDRVEELLDRYFPSGEK